MSDLGRALIVLGLVITALGVVLLFSGRLSWLGRLPGDIAIRRGNFTLYFPLATSLLLSLLLTVIFWLIGRR